MCGLMNQRVRGHAPLKRHDEGWQRSYASDARTRRMHFEHNTCAFPSCGYFALLGGRQEGVKSHGERARYVKTLFYTQDIGPERSEFPVGDFR